MTQETLCPDISYKIPENSTINVESMYINSFLALKCSMVSNARKFIESKDQSVQFCGQNLYRILNESDEKRRK